jgi:hypothetical protein
MNLFIVVATRGAEEISASIENSGFANYVVKDDTWLVFSNTSARRLSERLGIRGGENGSGLICLVEDYSGRLPSEAWQWLRNEGAQDE